MAAVSSPLTAPTIASFVQKPFFFFFSTLLSTGQRLYEQNAFPVNTKAEVLVWLLGLSAEATVRPAKSMAVLREDQ